MKFAVLDVETTGNRSEDEVIQFGLALIDDGEITSTYSSYVYTERIIPEFIVQMTGITQEMVQQAPPLQQVIAELIPLLEDRILVGHNVHFDLDFLQRSLASVGERPFSGRVLDTMDFLRMCFPQLGSLRLSMVCNELGVSLDRPHEAECDAVATAKIFLLCLEKLEQLPLLTVQRLASIFENGRPDSADIQAMLTHIRTKRETMQALDPDSGSYYRQIYLKVGDWREENEESIDEFDLTPYEQSFESFYAQAKSKLQSTLEHYEERAEQETMIHEVKETFFAGRHLLIEAGTGTGKSLAYLLPALYISLTQDRRVVVSTHTINLQEQLKNRDIPLLQNISPMPFKAAVIKGRNHYLCLRKFEQRLNARDFESKEQAVSAAQTLVWIGETLSGDDEELHISGRGKDFWRTVESDTNSCLNRACPWFKKCYFHRSRHAALEADVVITNHSMLLTDLRADHRIIPPYDLLVIDEAHHFEQTASKHLGVEVSYYSFLNPLGRLAKDAKNGMLMTLAQRLRAHEHEDSAAWAEQVEAAVPLCLEVKEDWEQLTGLLYEMAQGRASSSQNEGAYVHRLKAEQKPDSWSDAATIEDNIYLKITEMTRSLGRVLEQLKEADAGFELQSVVTDLNGNISDLIRLRDDLRFLIRLEDDNYVYWLEANNYYKHRSLSFMSVPIDVSELLAEKLFMQKESIVLTSATLTVNQTFDYAVEQLGLKSLHEEGLVKTVQLPSPFRYEEQALVLIPRDFPSIRGSYADERFLAQLAGSLADIALVTEGRMLVLFTSYRMLRQVHGELKSRLLGSQIQVFGQGIESNNRSKLVRMFQETPNCVLLGTSSFWEGVDIPGEALSLLAIVRLPFQPPNHPYVEAKSEYMKSRKENPFMKYSVPQAVIQFKQGFGRLVRTENDKGIVVVYDTRVIDTQYGKYFLRSLPGPRMEQSATEDMVARIRQWLA